MLAIVASGLVVSPPPALAGGLRSGPGDGAGRRLPPLRRGVGRDPRSVPLNASGVAHSSVSQDPASFGSYSFRARYGGDSDYAGTDGPCVVLTVTPLTPVMTTQIHNAAHTVVTAVEQNSVVHARATVTGSGLVPAGTVDFTFYTDAGCTAGATAAGTVDLNGSGVA
ncbi:MAG: Ig-like domain-containing protein, partial [Gemmatimonadales bacterium]